MYNEEWKNKFIEASNYKQSTEDTIRFIFEKAGKHERDFDTDMSSMSDEQISYVIDNIYGISKSSFKSIKAYINSYIEWCIKNVDCERESGISSISPGKSAFARFKSQMIMSPRHLQSVLDNIFDPEEMKTYDNLYRLYFWCAYSGLFESDIANLTEENFSLETQTINFNGKEYVIYRESIPAIKNAINLHEFVYYHPNYTDSIIRPRIDGKSVFRGIKSEMNLSTFKPMSSKRISESIKDGRNNVRLSYAKIQKSGMFYRAYEDEMIGIPPSFVDCAIDIAAHNGKILSEKEVYPTKQRLDGDYSLWKKVFYNT